MRIFLFTTCLVLLPVVLLGQSREKIKYRADSLEVFTKNGRKINKLSYNVIFKQQNTTVTCDSSFYFKDQNLMKAYGHVKIVDDSTDITSRRLIYEGANRMARLRENVVYVRGTRRLYTDSLDYQIDRDIATYFNGGKLVDTTNTLTSVKGIFYAQQNRAVFYKNVILISPDFTLKTDTLRYNTITKIAYTDGPTEIINEDGTQLFAKGGEFRTYIDQSQFIEGNVETTDYFLEGDELFFDDLNKYYKSIGNVELIAKSKDIIITGDEGYYDKKNGISKIYGSPIMKRILEKDTFYLAADTLIAIESEYDSAKRILAFHDIKVFKTNLQGLADSSSYFLSDSLIYLYRDPILWTGHTQITADTIILEVTEDKLKKMDMLSDAFMISRDTLKNFNQVKGRKMYSYFKNNNLNNIEVNGNGESIFYSLDKGDSLVLGMNRLLCGSMDIRFEENDISNISIYKKPEGRFIPPHELTEDVQKLQGFNWQGEQRPGLIDIYAKRTPGNEEEKRSEVESKMPLNGNKNKEELLKKAKSVTLPTSGGSNE